MQFRRHGHVSRGQALAEFAIVLPVLIALLGGVIQFGLIFWAQNTLTQVVRDTGRWAATQQYCALGTASDQVDIAGEANLVASDSSLLGYSSSSPWPATDETTAGTATYNTSESTAYGSAGDTAIQNFTTPEAVAVAWVDDSNPTSEPCPPTDNTAVFHVTIRINHTVPVLLPGLQYLPGIGTCDASGCHIELSSTAQFRLEPSPLGFSPGPGRGLASVHG